MWHNLTNHPAHQKGSDEGPKGSESKPDDKPDTDKKGPGESKKSDAGSDSK